MNELAMSCRVDARHRALLGNRQWNGIESIEVADDQLSLTVHLFGAAPAGLAPENIRIDGGRRITGIRALRIDVVADDSDENRGVVRIALDRYGDFSTYTLRLIDLVHKDDGSRSEKTLKGFDPRYAQLDFNFKVDCPGDFDCAAAQSCPPEAVDTPDINYLAKDYGSFRQLLLDRLATTLPSWRERHIPDLGVTLVELLAYVADQLSYHQDAVATEAYLDTARTRISVRRHARLVDYRLHEGCNARAWLTMTCTADVKLPHDAFFVTRHAEIARVAHEQTLKESDLESIATNLYDVFEQATNAAGEDVPLFAAHSTIQFYTWGDEECCLAKGTTRATLLDEATSPAPPAGDDPPSPRQKGARSAHATKAAPAPAGADTAAAETPPKRPLDALRVGDVLIFEEVLGPTTGNPADADPAHRHAVRLTGVARTVDGLLGRNVVEIEWAREDALPFPLCLCARLPTPQCTRIDGISVARGNVILVDHGRRIEEPNPWLVGVDDVVGDCGCDGAVVESTERPAPFAPVLRYAPLTFRQPPPPDGPAAKALTQDPTRALAQLVVQELPAAADATQVSWTVRSDLIGSSADARDVVVEVDDDGFGHLRFGDGRLGRQPPVGSTFSARYRVGIGASGNVAAEAIAYVGFRADSVDALSARNPLPARGGIAAQTLAEAKLAAPHEFRRKLKRAITADDYARLAEDDPALQRANARLAWTGSWYEAAVAIDPLGTETAPAGLLKRIDHRLERVRRAGHDLRVRPARYVPLAITLQICVKPDYLRGHVAAAASDALGNRRLADGSLGFFHPDRQSFGDDVYASDLIATVQKIDGVESVALIELRRLNRAAGHPASVPSVLELASFEIAELDNDPSFPERGKLTLMVGGGR